MIKNVQRIQNLKKYFVTTSKEERLFRCYA